MAFLVAVLLATCPPSGTDVRALKATHWSVEPVSAERLAFALLDCLAEPDPELRDGLAFEALQEWMRSGALGPEAVRRIGQRLLPRLSSADPEGFSAPFAALALAEVARVDRLRPFLTLAERDALVSRAAEYEEGVRDYRGFDEREGWRHGVAHGADLLMQLSLNPALTRAQLDRIIAAIAQQVLPEGHFYVYGEGERLARPVLFAGRRALHTREEWTAYFGRIAKAAALKEPFTQAGLARAHDARQFLLAIHRELSEGEDAAMRERMLPGVRAALRMAR